MSQLKWTKTRRKKLHGVRHPHKSDVKEHALSPDNAWAWLVQAWAERRESNTSLDAEPLYAERLARVVGQLDSGEAPTQLHVDDEMLRAALFLSGGPDTMGQRDASLIGLVGFWGGFEAGAACEVYEHVAEWNYAGSTTHRGSQVTWAGKITGLTPNPHGHKWAYRFRDGHHEYYLWPAYRRWLFAQTPERYADELAAATPLREALRASSEYSAGLGVAGLAFAFSREPDWANEEVSDLFDYLDKRAPQKVDGLRCEYVLPALTDPALAMELVQRWGSTFAYSADTYAFDIVESLGARAEPVLEALMTQNNVRSRERRVYTSALKLATSGS